MTEPTPHARASTANCQSRWGFRFSGVYNMSDSEPTVMHLWKDPHPMKRSLENSSCPINQSRYMWKVSAYHEGPPVKQNLYMRWGVVACFFDFFVFGSLFSCWSRNDILRIALLLFNARCSWYLPVKLYRTEKRRCWNRSFFASDSPCWCRSRASLEPSCFEWRDPNGWLCSGG